MASMPRDDRRNRQLIERRWKPDDGDDAILSPSSLRRTSSNVSAEEGSLSTAYYSSSCCSDDYTNASYDHTVNTIESDSDLKNCARNKKEDKNEKKKRKSHRRSLFRRHRDDDGTSQTSSNPFSKTKLKETKKAWNDLNVGFGSLMMD